VRNDLQLAIGQVFTPKFHCATSSTSPLWAVFFQRTGNLMWGTNVFHNPGACQDMQIPGDTPECAFGANAELILPPVVN
jgi:hypothetical protein